MERSSISACAALPALDEAAPTYSAPNAGYESVNSFLPCDFASMKNSTDVPDFTNVSMCHLPAKFAGSAKFSGFLLPKTTNVATRRARSACHVQPPGRITMVCVPLTLESNFTKVLIVQASLNSGESVSVKYTNPAPPSRNDFLLRLAITVGASSIKMGATPFSRAIAAEPPTALTYPAGVSKSLYISNAACAGMWLKESATAEHKSTFAEIFMKQIP